MRLVKRTEIEKPDKVYNLHVKNNNNYIANDIVVSNCHGCKAIVLNELLQMCPNARWRFGFTGTMPSQQLDCLQVQSYLGPVLREYGASRLAKMGYVAEAFIKMVHIEYKVPPRSSHTGKKDICSDNSHRQGLANYNEIKDICFNNSYRQGLIKDIIKNSDGNVLILVGKVSDEGETLKTVLEEDETLKDHEIKFLSGKDSATERERWRKCMDDQGEKVIKLFFGETEIQISPDENIPLTDGSFKKASEITIDDDIADDWITSNISKD